MSWFRQGGRQAGAQGGEEPRFDDYMIGRLVGAALSMIHYMRLHGDEQAKEFAETKVGTVNAFLEPEMQIEPSPIVIDVKPLTERTAHGD